ncbi:MAG: hypothetical protein IBJ10_01205 [Phycisphaerales bacterium]|nr:hypothetical protein [Phycisphaerales bacterium]
MSVTGGRHFFSLETYQRLTADARKLLTAIERHASPDGVCLAAVADLAHLSGIDAHRAWRVIGDLTHASLISMRQSPAHTAREWIILHSPYLTRAAQTASLSPPPVAAPGAAKTGPDESGLPTAGAAAGAFRRGAGVPPARIGAPA